MKVYIKSSTDPANKNNKYVLVCVSGSNEGQLFIDARKEGYGNYTYYTPNFTSARMNNYNRAKIFNSYEDAENFMLKQIQTKGNIFKYSPVTIVTYGEAMNEIGDPYANQKAYQQSQKDKKKQYAEQYKDIAKARNEKNKIKDPGKYKVTFYYSNSWLGSESYTVDAESIDDAFKQAKEKALRQDPYRNVSGYDHKMTFSKNYIRKID